MVQRQIGQVIIEGVQGDIANQPDMVDQMVTRCVVWVS